MGLKWSKLDFENNQLYINLTRQRIRKEGVIEKEPKTYGSIRYVAFTPSTAKLLKKLKTEQNKQKKKLGDKWNNNEFIFKTAWGYPMDPSRASNVFKEIRERHNL